QWRWAVTNINCRGQPGNRLHLHLFHRHHICSCTYHLVYLCNPVELHLLVDSVSQNLFPYSDQQVWRVNRRGCVLCLPLAGFDVLPGQAQGTAPTGIKKELYDGRRQQYLWTESGLPAASWHRWADAMVVGRTE